MSRRSAFTILIFVLSIVAIVFLYRKYKATAVFDQGAVTCIGCMSPERKAIWDRKNSGDTPDGESEHKVRSAAADATNNNPADFPPSAPASDSTTNQRPTTTYQPAATPPASTPATYIQAPAPPPPAAAQWNPPTADSLPANPPNGLHFTGQGSFQWFRQGNITWRLNTSNGSSCIAYATMEEWSKPIVMMHGCGRSA